MQKNKKKINILDVAIFVAILCSLLVLVFRDTISEAFGKPEIVTLEITVVSEKLSEEKITALEEGKTLEITPSSDSETKINAKIVSVKTEKNGNVTITLSCTGYKRLGRYFTESNQNIDIRSDCTVKTARAEFKGRLENVKVGD